MAKHQKHRKQAKQANGTKVIRMTDAETAAEEENSDEEEDESGIYLERIRISFFENPPSARPYRGRR
jgi:hypothetical protein